MAIAYDNSASVSSASNVASLETAAWTVSGTNRILVAGAASGAGTPADVSAIKWGGSGGVDLTLIGSHVNLGSFGRASWWRLRAPATGSSTLYAAWASNQDETVLGGVSYTGVRQIPPNGVQVTANTGGTATPTVDVTPDATGVVVDAVFALNTNGDISGIAAGAGQTTRVDIDAVGGGAFECFGMSDEVCASGVTTTMSWTVTTATPLNTDWAILAVPLREAAGGPFNLAVTGGVALSGRAAVSGDITAGAPFDLAVTGIDLRGALSVAGNIGFKQPWEFETPLQISQITGALRLTGDLGFNTRFDVAPVSPVVLAAALRVSGDLGFSTRFDVASVSPIALAGRVSVAGDAQIQGPFDLQAQSLVLHGALYAQGDLGLGTRFDAAPSAVTLSGRLAVAGAINILRAGVLDLTFGSLAIRGALSTGGDIQIGLPVVFDLPAGAVALHGTLHAQGDLGIGTRFDLSVGAVALHGGVAAAADLLAGSPFDLSGGTVALHGRMAATGDPAAGTAPPAPPAPAPGIDPLDPRLIAKRKRPNVRMRWGAGEPPVAPPAVPEVDALPPSADAPVILARGMDLGLLPAPAAPAPAPTPEVDPAPVAPAPAPAAPPTVPLADFEAVRAQVARWPEHLAQVASEAKAALQAESEARAALTRQVEQLTAELRAAREETAALKARIERDARNRKRAEEIARRLLDE